MNEPKFCPILLTTAPVPINKELLWCRKERCAWWRSTSCAIVGIAEACESIEYVGDAVAEQS